MKDQFEHFPEIDKLEAIIHKTFEDYKLAKKLGQQDQAKLYKATIKELKFAKEHLRRVMNLDFS